MDNSYIELEELIHLYPNEWVLLGNPKMKNTSVSGGIVLYHSKDKKEVCYLGKEKIADYSTVTITFTGQIKHNRKIGILKRI